MAKTAILLRQKTAPNGFIAVHHNDSEFVDTIKQDPEAYAQFRKVGKSLFTLARVLDS